MPNFCSNERRLTWRFDTCKKKSEDFCPGVYIRAVSVSEIVTCFINALRPRQNECHFADDIFKCILLNENVWIPIKISMMFVPEGLIYNIPALVQIMAWRRPGDKTLSEPMLVFEPTHKCVTRPQWLNKWQYIDISWISVTFISDSRLCNTSARVRHSKLNVFRSLFCITCNFFK